LHFINKAPLYEAVHITGPKHNLLGLELTENPDASPLVEVLNADQGPTHLNPDDITEFVLKGVAAASKEVGKSVYVRRIRCLTSDSPPPAIYEYLAAEIVRRAALI
jgi:hypothetical protein